MTRMHRTPIVQVTSTEANEWPWGRGLYQSLNEGEVITGSAWGDWRI